VVQSRRRQNNTCAALLVVWGISFFLPAMQVDTFGNGRLTQRGWELALSSMVFFWFPYYGQLWLVNPLMATAPYFLKRIRNGKGRVYVIFLAIFAILPLGFPFFPNAGFMETFRGLAFGFYVWTASLLGMAILCIGMISDRAKALAPHTLAD